MHQVPVHPLFVTLRRQRLAQLLALLTLGFLAACSRVAPEPQPTTLEPTAAPTHVAVAQWGGFGSGSGLFRYPHGAAVDQHGYVYVSDRNNNRVQKFAPDGTHVLSWGSRGGGAGQFSSPLGVAAAADGHLYVVDTGNSRVQKFGLDGTFVTAWGGAGSGDGQFSSPNGVAVDGQGYVYVTDTGNRRVQKFSADGTFVSKWGGAGSGNGQFDKPAGIAVSSDGRVYVGDFGSHRIQRFSSSGVFELKWGGYGTGAGQFRQPHGIAVDQGGQVFVADKNNLRVQVFTAAGAGVGQWEAGGSEQASASYPLALAVDANERVYVTDMFNSFVRVFAPAPEGSVHVLVTTSARGAFGQNAAVRATVKVNSDPLGGAAVDFFLNDVAVGSAVTDVAGTATLSGVPLAGFSAGVHRQVVRAQFTSGDLSGGARGLLVVNRAEQTLAFTSPELPRAALGSAHLFTAAASSGLPVTIDSLTPEVCTLEAGRATFIALGTCVVRATQGGNTNYHGAPALRQSIAVTSSVPTNLSGVAGSGRYGGAATLSARLEADGATVAGRTVTFTLGGRTVGSALTDARGDATLQGVALTGFPAGTHAGVVTAAFAGTPELAGGQLSGPLAVARAPQTLSFGAVPTAGRVGEQHAVTARSSAGLPVTIVSEEERVCRVGGGTVSFYAAGSCTLRATQAGDQNHEPAPEAVQLIAVAAPPPPTLHTYTLTFDQLALGRIVWNASLGRGIVSSSGTNRNNVVLYAKRRDRNGNMAMVAGTRRQLLISSDGRTGRSYAKGGYLDVSFGAFKDAVSVKSLRIYGATTVGGTVEVIGAQGVLKQLTIPRTTSSGSTVLTVDAQNVVKLRVNLTGPGSLDDLIFEAAH
jgi:sugar lactone lactonase YvrE